MELLRRTGCRSRKGEDYGNSKSLKGNLHKHDFDIRVLLQLLQLLWYIMRKFYSSVLFKKNYIRLL